MAPFRAHLLLAVWVLVGSSIPFVPTGEMVTGASALASKSEIGFLVVFVITWTCSSIGDLILLLEARLSASRIHPWLDRRPYGAKVRQAQLGLRRNAFQAVVVGRLIPGGRAPIVIALGLDRYPAGRFFAFDLVACALWAGIYTTIGTIGGRISDHPVFSVLIPIAIATTLGGGFELIRRYRPGGLRVRCW